MQACFFVSSSHELRSALGMFATGVTIVTTRRATGRPIGLTANSFTSVSLSPPLVLWSLSKQSTSLPIFRDSMHYVINILSASQHQLALRFATRGMDRFSQVQWHPGQNGAPIIDGVVAHFECRKHKHYLEGDHELFIGEVEHCAHNRQGRPLLFHGGNFYTETLL